VYEEHASRHTRMQWRKRDAEEAARRFGFQFCMGMRKILLHCSAKGWGIVTCGEGGRNDESPKPQEVENAAVFTIWVIKLNRGADPLQAGGGETLRMDEKRQILSPKKKPTSVNW